MSDAGCVGWCVACALGGFMFALFWVAARMELCECGKHYDGKKHAPADAPRES